eukprot:1178005-Prorocentrum_minimum.AAC.4
MPLLGTAGRDEFKTPEYTPISPDARAISVEGAQHCAREFVSPWRTSIRRKFPHLESRAPYTPTGVSPADIHPSGQRGLKRQEPEQFPEAEASEVKIGERSEQEGRGEAHPMQELFVFLKRNPRVMDLLTQQATGVYEVLFDALIAVDAAYRSKQEEVKGSSSNTNKASTTPA